jgi:PAS domain S-box-containing protein/putative nucleotidyltransferase with HDIG domain
VVRDISERKRAQDALRDSEVKYRHLFENTQTAMEVISGETGLVVLTNQATARIFGFASPDDLIGVDSMEYLLPEDRDRVVSQMAQALVDENWNESTELRVRTKDGRLLWINGMVTHSEYQGKPALLVSMLDMTSRKEAELKVAESEEKYRLLTEKTADIIWTADLSLRPTYVSPSIEKVLGFTPEEHLKQPVEAQMTPASYANVQALLQEELRREQEGRNDPERTIRGETEYYHKNGSTVWMENLVSAVRDKEGHIIGVHGVSRDVRDRRQAEEEAKLAAQEWEETFNSITDMISIQDKDSHIVRANKAFTDRLGMKSNDINGRKCYEIVHGTNVPWPDCPHQKCIASGRPCTEELWEPRLGKYLQVSVSPLFNSSNAVAGSVHIARDITKRRKTEEALHESEEKYRLLVENASEAIFVIQDGLFKFPNPKALAIMKGLGYTQQEMETRPFAEVIHPEDRQTVLQAHLRRLAGEEFDHVSQFRAVGTSGEIRWMELDSVRLPWEGRPAVLVFLNDVTERKRAEDAFRESESRYRLLAENVSDVIWSLNMKSRQPFFSPSVTRLLGYTVEEVTSLRIKEVVTPTSYPRAMMTFSKLSAQQGNGSDGRHSSTQIEVELMRKDGSFVWVDISVTLVRDAEGQPAEVFGVIRDVTQRKKAEEALRTSEEYFRTLIENAWDAIAIVNAEGTMLYESPSSARIMGYEPEEIVGRNLMDFVRPEDVAANVDMFRRFRTDPGSTVMIDAGFRHKDGHYIECEGTLQNLLHDPKVNGIIANYRDVTDRRRAEEAILASEERFRNLVEATSDWVWETDPSGSYTYASSKACEVLGYEVSEIVGRSIFDFMPSRESSRFARTFKSHAEKREPFAFLETSRQRKDGKVIVMETSGVPFFGGDGTLLGYRGIGRDITNRKNIERELEKSVKKLEKTMEAAIQAISYTMETRDPYTTGHQKRVTQLSCAIAKEMGLAAWQIDGIRVAGLLHDIGKIAVPTEILSKPGKLSDIEFSMIKAHPKVGFDILKNVEFEWPIARVVVQHHERLDGSGYPYGIRGKDILQEARVLAVADVVEAMSSHRPYRAALGIEKALAEVARGEGTLYDPDVARACAKVFNERGFKFES